MRLDKFEINNNEFASYLNELDGFATINIEDKQAISKLIKDNFIKFTTSVLPNIVNHCYSRFKRDIHTEFKEIYPDFKYLNTQQQDKIITELLREYILDILNSPHSIFKIEDFIFRCRTRFNGYKFYPDDTHLKTYYEWAETNKKLQKKQNIEKMALDYVKKIDGFNLPADNNTNQFIKDNAESFKTKFPEIIRKNYSEFEEFEEYITEILDMPKPEFPDFDNYLTVKQQEVIIRRLLSEYLVNEIKQDGFFEIEKFKIFCKLRFSDYNSNLNNKKYTYFEDFNYIKSSIVNNKTHRLREVSSSILLNTQNNEARYKFIKKNFELFQRTILPEIVDYYFKEFQNKIELILEEHAKNFPDFKYLDSGKKEEVSKKLLKDHVINLINAEKSFTIEGFQLFCKARFNKYESFLIDEDSKYIKTLINQSKIEKIKLYLKNLFLKTPEDKDYENLLYVLSENIEDNTKKLKEYFDNIHKSGQIICDNGIQIDIKESTEGLLAKAVKWILGVEKIQELGASQALLSRFGLLHIGPSSIITEGINATIIIDNAEMAGNVRKLFHTILLPLKPLAKEWFVLLPSETNYLIIGWRLLMPILIASIIVALGFLLISSTIVSMPAVFELLMIMPLTYLGFFTASLGITMRDYAYDKIMDNIYSGVYNRPEYRVNNALLSTFNKDNLAEKIRDYYVSEFKKCDELIIEVKNRVKNKFRASKEEQHYLIANSEARKDKLLDEWKKLTAYRQTEPLKNASEELINLVKKRVQLDSTIEYDFHKEKRDIYIEKCCKALADGREQHGFFKDNSKLIKYTKQEHEKIEKLRSINDSLRILQP